MHNKHNLGPKWGKCTAHAGTYSTIVCKHYLPYATLEPYLEANWTDPGTWQLAAECPRCGRTFSGRLCPRNRRAAPWWPPSCAWRYPATDTSAAYTGWSSLTAPSPSSRVAGGGGQKHVLCQYPNCISDCTLIGPFFYMLIILRIN